MGNLFRIAHTHHFGGVDVPFGDYDLFNLHGTSLGQHSLDTIGRIHKRV